MRGQRESYEEATLKRGLAIRHEYHQNAENPRGKRSFRVDSEQFFAVRTEIRPVLVYRLLEYVRTVRTGQTHGRPSGFNGLNGEDENLYPSIAYSERSCGGTGNFA
jgi:hypothetical protein